MELLFPEYAERITSSKPIPSRAGLYEQQNAETRWLTATKPR